MAVLTLKLLLFLHMLLSYTTKSSTALESHSEDINSRLLGIMQGYINTHKDPCVDFYEYACGNWSNAVEVDGKVPANAFSHLENQYNDKLKHLLLQNVNVSLPNKAVEELFFKLQLYYESCQKLEMINITSYMELLKPMDTEEWPAEGDTWNPAREVNIWSILGKLATVGFDDLLFEIKVERHNKTSYHIQLDKFKDNSYERRTAYHMSFSANQKIKTIGQSMNVFLSQLYRINYNNMESKPVEMTLEELQQKIPDIDFISFFSDIMGNEHLRDIPVIIQNLPYFRQLAELLQQTTQQTLIHIIKLSLEGYLQQIIAKDCMMAMRNVLALPLDYLYELKVYSSRRKSTNAIIETIFKALKQKCLDILQKHPHKFSLQEMHYLQAKIKQMKLNIGNIPQNVTHHYYSQHYSNWMVQKDNFYYNHLSALKHKNLAIYNMLKSGIADVQQTFSDWPWGSPTYTASKNLIALPLAYLNFPVFHSNFHDVFQYASVGQTLAHEMMHGLSSSGLNYDFEGKPSSIFAKHNSTSNITNYWDCLLHNPTFNVAERLADFSGFHLAYDTYFQQIVIPEFTWNTNFTNKQLFYLKFAQFYCGNEDINYQDISHDLPATRVLRTVINSREFEEVFDCSREVNELIEEKCNLW